jgi:hypothetical protein
LLGLPLTKIYLLPLWIESLVQKVVSNHSKIRGHFYTTFARCILYKTKYAKMNNGTSDEQVYRGRKMLMWYQKSKYICLYIKKTERFKKVIGGRWQDKKQPKGKEMSWPWSYFNGIYNYLCIQCLSPLKL